MNLFKLPKLLVITFLVTVAGPALANDAERLKLEWQDNWLTISGPNLPGKTLKVHYLEAYCRPKSTDRVWNETTIGHKTQLVSAATDGSKLSLRCTLADGVIVDHELTATADEVDLRLTASNPTDKASAAHWASLRARVGAFTGGDQDTYLSKCFIFTGGKLEPMPTASWATKALYTPGQVWCPKNVDRADVNPRPLNDTVPDNGLIGCYSADEKNILGLAFEPYQELFQGVGVCIHSDFRIGGLKPGETKQIRGKMYFVAQMWRHCSNATRKISPSTSPSSSCRVLLSGLPSSASADE